MYNALSGNLWGSIIENIVNGDNDKDKNKDKDKDIDVYYTMPVSGNLRQKLCGDRSLC